jgi:hypothetical protein
MASSDAERLLKDLFDYAKESRKAGIFDFSEIISGFRRKLGEIDASENPFAKKFIKNAKEFLASDPKYQTKLPLSTVADHNLEDIALPSGLAGITGGTAKRLLTKETENDGYSNASKTYDENELVC